MSMVRYVAFVLRSSINLAETVSAYVFTVLVERLARGVIATSIIAVGLGAQAWRPLSKPQPLQSLLPTNLGLVNQADGFSTPNSPSPVNDFTIDTTTTNLTDQMRGLCVNNCSAGQAAFSTVPYYTLDAPRNVTLLYNEDYAHPRPVVYADVTPTLGTPTQYTLQATLNSTTVTFLTGDTKIYFSGSASAVRLAGQFDASNYATGLDTLTVTITATYSGGGTVTHSYKRFLAIVNDAHSPYGRGIRVAGVQRLYFLANNQYFIVDDHSAIWFSGLGVTAADFTTLTYDAVNNYYTRTYQDGTRARFTTTGLLSNIFDRLGNNTAYHYDGLNRLWYITDPVSSLGTTSAQCIVFTYGAYGLGTIYQEPKVPSPPHWSTTTFTVASDSTLRTITDPDGVATNLAYDASGRLSRIINRRGDTTTYQYDAHSWKISEVDLPRIAVDIGSGSTTNVIPKIKYKPWLTVGIPISATSIGSPATPINTSAVKDSVIDPLGRVTSMMVNRWGQPVAITDPLSRTTTITRVGILPVKVLHPNGGVDTMAYVGGTPLLRYIRTAGDSAFNYHYGALGQIDSIWGPSTIFERHFLSSTTGRVDSIQYAHTAALTIRYTYDGFNRLISAKDIGTHITAYHYDAVFGNIDSVSRPGNIYTIRRLDAFGRDTANRSAGDLVWQCTSYDTLNRVRKTWHHRLGSSTLVGDSTNIVYDAAFPIRVRAPGGSIYKFSTNALGLVTRRYDSKDTSLFISYRYDTAGQMTSMTNRRGQIIAMTYDALGRILSRTVSSTLTDNFYYDLNDRWSAAWRNNVSRDTTFFNVNGEVDSIVRKIAGHRYAMNYGYAYYQGRVLRGEAYVNDAGISFPGRDDIVRFPMPTTDSTVTYSAYYAGTSWNSKRAWQSRDIDGRPTLSQFEGSGARGAQHFSALHEQYWSVIDSGAASAARDSLSRSFMRDSTGRVVFDALWTNDSGKTPNRNFVYDSLGRLLKVKSNVDGSCITSADTLALGFQYSCGSRFSSVTQDSSAYDAAGNRLFVGATYSTTGKRLLTGPSGVSYTYDADGNVVTRTHGSVTDSLFWSSVGLLDSVASGGTNGLRHRYEYNSYGQLVRRQTAVHSGAYSVDRYYVWEENRMLAELDGPTGTSYRAQYVYAGQGDHPIAIVTFRMDPGYYGSFLRTLYQDPVEGNLTGILSDTSSLAQYTQYSAWGQILHRNINTMTDTNRLGWKGLMYEGDSTRLYYIRNRWYDPAIGRFVSEDPIGIAGGPNLYAFAGNDPINGGDPSGLYDGDDEEDGVHGLDSFITYEAGRVAHWISKQFHHRHHPTKPAIAVANAGSAGVFNTDPEPEEVTSFGLGASAFWGVGLTISGGIYTSNSDVGAYFHIGGGFGVDQGLFGEYQASTSMEAFGGVSDGGCAGAIGVEKCYSYNNSGSTSGYAVGRATPFILAQFQVTRSYTATLGLRDILKYAIPQVFPSSTPAH